MYQFAVIVAGVLEEVMSFETLDEAENFMNGATYGAGFFGGDELVFVDLGDPEVVREYQRDPDYECAFRLLARKGYIAP